MTTLALSVFAFYVRELVASFAIFSAAFLMLTLAVLTPLFIWSASRQMAIMAMPTSRNVLAFSRRLLTVYAKS